MERGEKINVKVNGRHPNRIEKCEIHAELERIAGSAAQAFIRIWP